MVIVDIREFYSHSKIDEKQFCVAVNYSSFLQYMHSVVIWKSFPHPRFFRKNFVKVTFY